MNNEYGLFSLLARKEVVESSVGVKITTCADMSHTRRVAVHEQRRRHGAVPCRIGQGHRDDAVRFSNR